MLVLQTKNNRLQNDIMEKDTDSRNTAKNT